MNDKLLADAIVRLGVVADKGSHYELPNGACILIDADLVRDPRVAMALMEKCVGKPEWMPMQIDRKVSSEVTHRCWIERTYSGTKVDTYHARNESLPRAITEACVEALT